MDIKVDGLSYEVLEKALLQARDGRMHILDKIQEAIAEPREDYKPHVPRIVTMTIPKDLIGAVIGPGLVAEYVGKNGIFSSVSVGNKPHGYTADGFLHFHAGVKKWTTFPDLTDRRCSPAARHKPLPL